MNFTFIKLKKAILICCFGSLATSASARILRVNNNIGITAEYTSVLTAVTAALAGDTVYVEPSPITYTEASGGTPYMTINRKITILGNGSFLATHPGLQVNINDSYFAGNIIFAPGSENSIVSGLRFYTFTINDGVNNITLRRCRVESSITITGTGSNNFILENWIASYITRSSGIQTNFLIKNNIIQNSITILLNDMAIIENNTSVYSTASSIALAMNGSTRSFVYNNIFVGNITNPSGVADAFKNNISAGSSLPTGNGNQNNVLMTNVFVTYPFVNDGDAMLRVASPAINAGLYGSGDDIGAFNDGTNRPTFVLGLIPPVVPTIYSVSGVGIINTQFMNVTISTRSNN